MTSTNEYALMAANAYLQPGVVSALNALPIPEGWTLIEDRVSATGFHARVFQRGSEVVIAYTGTTPGAIDWLTGNIPAGGGIASPQVIEAALLYQDLKSRLPDTTSFSFTGHSLGGGLASLMAVFFDQPATIFDPAPFEKSADSTTVVIALSERLISLESV
ncbi:MAG: lipase family protein [Pyrinomonadaceae bacterium]